MSYYNYMRLSKTMIQAFHAVVHGKNTLEKIAFHINKSLKQSSVVVNDLEREGFIRKQRDYKIKGSRILIDIAPTSHATKLKVLIFEYQYLKFEDILSDSKLLFLAALSEDWMTLKEASKLSKISKYMIDKYKKSLQNRGIIIRKKTFYTINKKMWPSLHEFLLEYKNYSTIKGNVKWKYQDEVLFEVDSKELIQGLLTGFAKYKDYGVLVRIISALCKLPASKISKEEIFVHSLFEVDDPRTLHLALTFYLKNKLKYGRVLPIAMRYGKYTMFENFVKLLKTKEDKVKLEVLPIFDRKDFIRIAHMYGVKDV